MRTVPAPLVSGPTHPSSEPRHLLEEGCEEFSNIEGLGQIRFPKNNIRAAFHDVQLVLEREGLVEPPGE
jgi:hypothetical protein